MSSIVINIYWDDLSETGKETLGDAGFVPTDAQIKEQEPIGAIATGISDDELDRKI